MTMVIRFELTMLLHRDHRVPSDFRVYLSVPIALT